MTLRDDKQGAAPLNELLGDAMRHGADLVGSEMALLRAELASNVRQIAAGLAMLVFSAVFLIIALGLAIDALVASLAPVLGSQGAAAFACAAGAAVVAGLLCFVGVSKVRMDTLYPDRTAASIKRDAQMIQRRVS